MNKVNVFVLVCNGDEDITNLREKSLIPCLADVEIMEAVVELGCELIQCYGEADPFIAQQFLVFMA